MSVSGLELFARDVRDVCAPLQESPAVLHGLALRSCLHKFSGCSFVETAASSCRQQSGLF